MHMLHSFRQHSKSTEGMWQSKSLPYLCLLTSIRWTLFSFFATVKSKKAYTTSQSPKGIFRIKQKQGAKAFAVFLLQLRLVFTRLYQIHHIFEELLPKMSLTRILLLHHGKHIRPQLTLCWILSHWCAKTSVKCQGLILQSWWPQDKQTTPKLK